MCVFISERERDVRNEINIYIKTIYNKKLGVEMKIEIVRVETENKRWRGQNCQSIKLITKTIRESFDKANGLEKLRNLRHCSRNIFFQ